jgi:hypothetical protein
MIVSFQTGLLASRIRFAIVTTVVQCRIRETNDFNLPGTIHPHPIFWKIAGRVGFSTIIVAEGLHPWQNLPLQLVDQTLRDIYVIQESLTSSYTRECEQDIYNAPKKGAFHVGRAGFQLSILHGWYCCEESLDSWEIAV